MSRSLLNRLVAGLAALLVVLGLGATSLPARAAVPAADDLSAAAAQNVRVLTYNMNFYENDAAVAAADLGAMLNRSDVLLLQEAKTHSVQALVDRLGRGGEFVVRQDLSSSPKMGSAVVVRRSAVSEVAPLQLFLGAERGCPNVQARWIAKVKLTLANGAILNVASAHFPLPSCSTTMYAEMVSSVVTVLNNNAGSMVLGADWNKDIKTDPDNVLGKTDNRYRISSAASCGSSTTRCVDGLIAAIRFGASAPVVYPGNSDHDAIGVTYSVSPI